MAAILNHWKKEKISQGTLSNRELSKKADGIEQHLDTGLEALTDKLSPTSTALHYTTLHKSEEDRRNLTIDRLTQAFGYAAKVYLNVVVSGPNPEVREITESVKSTLASLQQLPDIQYLRNAVWPFCIAGSMATKQHRQAFRDLANEAEIHRDIYGTSWRALEVMEMFWKLRDEGRECDWVDAME